LVHGSFLPIIRESYVQTMELDGASPTFFQATPMGSSNHRNIFPLGFSSFAAMLLVLVSATTGAVCGFVASSNLV
jgi:hypothetical protein